MRAEKSTDAGDAMAADLTRLERRRAMFLRAIEQMGASEAQIKLELGDRYVEPESLIWVRRDLAATEAEIARAKESD